jgi:hypothetical protein
MSYRLGHVALAFVVGFAFLLTNAAPFSFELFGIEPAFAKKGGKSDGRGGGGGKSGKGGSHASASGGNGKSGAPPGKIKLNNATSVAKAKTTGLGVASTGTPKAVVRQYVLLNDHLKQGDVAKLLKSWNSLNRNEQAYLNNIGNLNSLPGLQIAYISENMEARAAFAAFDVLDEDEVPPTPEEDAAAQLSISQYEAWLAYQDAVGSPEEVELFAAFNELDEDGIPPTQEQYDDALVLTDQYDAWTAYEGAETEAQDAFMAASVSYKGEIYDAATFGELRKLVDEIVALKNFETLLSESDDAGEPTEPEPIATE